MEIMIFALVVLAAALVMASGLWVATVLVAAILRVRRPAESTRKGPSAEQTNP